MELAVAACIATHGRPRELARLLDSLGKIERGLALVVVVDNAGCAETRAAVEAARFPTQLVTPGENLGCGGGLRLAEETALRLAGDRCTHLLVLDDDAVLAPDTLDLLAAAMEAESADAACPLVLAPGGGLGWPPGLADRRAHRLAESLLTVADFRTQIGTAPLPLLWTQGICLLVTRRAIADAGLHRADFWVRGEDLEFSLRLSASHRLVVVPAAVVEHLPPPSSGALSDEAEYLKHAAMLQNIAYLSYALPHGRRIAWTVPANVWRFLRPWGWRALPDAIRALYRGALCAEPAGGGTGRTFLARSINVAWASAQKPPTTEG